MFFFFSLSLSLSLVCFCLYCLSYVSVTACLCRQEHWSYVSVFHLVWMLRCASCWWWIILMFSGLWLLHFAHWPILTRSSPILDVCGCLCYRHTCLDICPIPGYRIMLQRSSSGICPRAVWVLSISTPTSPTHPSVSVLYILLCLKKKFEVYIIFLLTFFISIWNIFLIQCCLGIIRLRWGSCVLFLQSGSIDW